MATLIQRHAATEVDTNTYWQIDPANSTIGFSIKHMLFATAHGRFSSFRGTIRIDDELPDQSFVMVQIDADSIDTSEPRRDAHLRSEDFFAVGVYPTITFQSTRVELTNLLRADHWLVVGDLTIHGITQSVELNVEQTDGRGPWDTDVLSFMATTKSYRKDFGIGDHPPLTGGGLVIGDDVNITLDIHAVKRLNVEQ